MDTSVRAPLAAPLPAPPAGVRTWRRQGFPTQGLLLAALFAAFALLPSARANPRLLWTFVGVGAGLAAWALILGARGRAAGRSFVVEISVVRAHYVQACVQSTILLYWGWYASAVYPQLPFIVAQIVFLYAFDALISWSRGRSWRLGFGPLPIILSTNLLLWFKDDWFVLQLAMVATGALGKQFVVWRREGRATHIFNPSVFGQFLFAVVLIATGTTEELTWGKEIAASFDSPPHIFLLLFLLGLVVQGLFSVTLMTLAGVATIVALNLAYTQTTGVYYFLNSNLGAAVFLGLHLLMTDPSTSPRSNLGRVLFGASYAVLYFALYRVLDDAGVPLFWDKLLPMPILNLGVPLFDRVARSGLLGRFNRWWETSFAPRRANLVHMGCWTALFATMLGTGYVEAPHPGDSLGFWKQAYEEGKPLAARNYKKMLIYATEKDDAAAFTLLGHMYLRGELLPLNRVSAANCFARACNLGDAEGCENLARLFLGSPGAQPTEAVAHAFERLETLSATGTDGAICFVLGSAYEAGHGRPRDLERARALFEEGCRRGDSSACARLQR